MDYNKKFMQSETELIIQKNTKLSEFKKLKLEAETANNWDRFYKRNETKFFKDRHWPSNEFKELLPNNIDGKCMLDVGCGVGNFLLPLIQNFKNTKFYACDFSIRAIGFLKSDERYDENCVNAFVSDISEIEFPNDKIPINSIDIVSLIFVLSAINPIKMRQVVHNIFKVTKVGGIILFRDYAINDHAMIRFKSSNKIDNQFYVRQDNTFAYFFTKDELLKIFEEVGFISIDISYIYRNTINRKENISVQRIFLQAKFCKPNI